MRFQKIARQKTSDFTGLTLWVKEYKLDTELCCSECGIFSHDVNLTNYAIGDLMESHYQSKHFNDGATDPDLIWCSVIIEETTDPNLGDSIFKIMDVKHLPVLVDPMPPLVGYHTVVHRAFTMEDLTEEAYDQRFRNPSVFGEDHWSKRVSYDQLMDTDRNTLREEEHIGAGSFDDIRCCKECLR